MAVSHPGFKSYYVRVSYHGKEGFKFEPHHLTVPANTLATITWFTEDPGLAFTDFIWYDKNEHCSEHPLVRGSYMVGAVQTMDVQCDSYWQYQVKANLKRGKRPVEMIHSTGCKHRSYTDGLPAIHPR